MARYQTYHVDNKTIVVSKYAGKTVRGVAKCAPGDLYNAVSGEDLARLRCDEKIAVKRVARSQEAYAAAVENLLRAQKRVDAMKNYMSDASGELDTVRAELAKLEASL